MGSQRNEMNRREKEDIVRRWMQEMDSGNVDVLDELCTPGYVCHFPGNLEPLEKDVHKVATRVFYGAFPDFRHEVEDVFAVEDRAVLRAIGAGTHSREILGLEPTGKKVRMSVMFMFRFEGDQIAEAWGEADLISLLRQLGALPFLEELGASGET